MPPNALSVSLSPPPTPPAYIFASAAILPSIVDDGPLPAALLAKSYKKPGLSDLDRYHAKFGDIGIKYMKRCMPSLQIPKQYRCDICIDGKIHKFGHKACAEGVRKVYQPGVCIHTDHSGPYARSLSGARYSQLFLDRGSGYLWGFRQKKKTDSYAATPKVFLDSWALSGRKVQIFQSDGEGVFMSGDLREILEAEKVRHEWGAPYDSDTNPFIERARRTIFEGVSTALIRSGAPARFWGEAECHKIYTLNILPTQPDPDKEGSFCSRRMLLEGNRRPPDFEKLMAFGTAATCYIPKDLRKGGKEPAQRRSFHGVILGYAENMPAYRVWDLEAQKIKSVSYNFTITHEGYYPFRDKTTWPPDFSDDPENFSPTMSGVLTISEWKKFDFDPADAEEVLEKTPDLLVSRPDPVLHQLPVEKSVKNSLEEKHSDEKTVSTAPKMVSECLSLPPASAPHVLSPSSLSSRPSSDVSVPSSGFPPSRLVKY